MRGPRLIPLGIAVLITQVALFPQLRFSGVVPDLGLLFAAAVGLHEGSEAGAWFGFFVGLGYDLFLPTPLGLTALTYASCAWLVGYLHGAISRRSALLFAGIGFAVGLVGGLIFVATAILAGADSLQSGHSLVVVLKLAVYDMLLAPPVFALVAMLLRLGEPARV
jgi:rod shape-determining protein MreD